MYRYEPVLLRRETAAAIVTLREGRDMTNNLLQAVWDGDLARVREMIAEEPEGVNWPTVNSKVNKVLVGNKSDNQSARQVSTQEGQALAAEYDVRFIEASAKADVNVTEAFQAIAQQVIDRIPRGMSRPASRQLSSKKSSKKSCSC